jgi:hypothetical protein
MNLVKRGSLSTQSFDYTLVTRDHKIEVSPRRSEQCNSAQFVRRAYIPSCATVETISSGGL